MRMGARGLSTTPNRHRRVLPAGEVVRKSPWCMSKAAPAREEAARGPCSGEPRWMFQRGYERLVIATIPAPTGAGSCARDPDGGTGCLPRAGRAMIGVREARAPPAMGARASLCPAPARCETTGMPCAGVPFLARCGVRGGRASSFLGRRLPPRVCGRRGSRNRTAGDDDAPADTRCTRAVEGRRACPRCRTRGLPGSARCRGRGGRRARRVRGDRPDRGRGAGPCRDARISPRRRSTTSGPITPVGVASRPVPRDRGTPAPPARSPSRSGIGGPVAPRLRHVRRHRWSCLGRGSRSVGTFLVCRTWEEAHRDDRQDRRRAPERGSQWPWPRMVGARPSTPSCPNVGWPRRAARMHLAVRGSRNA